MNFFEEWMQNLTVFVLLYGLVMEILPDRKYEPYARLFLGLFLILILIYPIYKIGSLEKIFQNAHEEVLEKREDLEERMQWKIKIGEDLSGDFGESLESIEPVQIEKIKIGEDHV